MLFAGIAKSRSNSWEKAAALIGVVCARRRALALALMFVRARAHSKIDDMMGVTTNR